VTASRHLSPDFDVDGQRPAAAAIAALWAELFGDEELVVAPGDNFFTLGGSSRLALELVGRLNERFGIRLTLMTLVEAPVFRDLVARVTALAPADVEEGEL
jgi:acyl carrier protein